MYILLIFYVGFISWYIAVDYGRFRYLVVPQQTRNKTAEMDGYFVWKHFIHDKLQLNVVVYI